MDNSDLQRAMSQADRSIAVTVLYFARLREALGAEQERLDLPANVHTVGALRAHLRTRGEKWARELADDRPVRIAVNQDMATASTPLRSGDEVAFFPPVTGG
ncbi:MAG TPA: molybdopterin converting factor subunit 1 [Burkholderiales bacterium]|nr:molybdopterin converting factor subunit 1 [Burkholderiales bacterium]